MRDDLLIRKIKQGEADLLDTLIARYYDDVLRFCFYKTGDENLAYDCTQDTFLRFIKYIRTYKESKKFKAYILKIATNVCNDNLSARGRMTATEDGTLEGLLEEEGKVGIANHCEGGYSQEDIATKVANADLVNKALAVLPDAQRDVVILRFYNDLKIGEIAKVTGASVPTVKFRLHDGMKKMKDFMEREDKA